MRTRVKICGITRPEDGVQAAGMGADAIGLVFYQKSPRVVTIEQAGEIIKVLPVFVTTVALFVDADRNYVEAVLAGLDIDLLQFHGDETAEECGRYNKPYIKAVSMREGVDLQACCRQYPGASALLVDSYRAGVPGGTGELFDWERIPKNLPLPVILAGGLDADNVIEAIKVVKPYAVDVSSGVEKEKGLKDEGKIEAFIRGVNCVENE